MVIWSRPARGDLRQIHDYIARDSKYFARKVTDEIVEKSAQLQTFPLQGRVVPETDDPNIRELFLYSYRIIYEVVGKNVRVLAVIHAKQDILSSRPEILR